MHKLASLLAAAALSAPLIASASEPVALTETHETGHDWSVTVSPIHFILPFVEVMAELRTHGNWSAAGIVGLGAVDQDGENIFVGEVGGQGRYYVLGDFDHGLSLGGEILYLSAAAEDSDATAAGTSVGAFLGYKYAAGFGATIDVQGGVAVLAIDSHDDDEMDQADVFPLVNLNAGWSF